MQGPSKELAIGDRAPDFVLPGPDNKFYQFYERTRGRPQILFFYPGKKSDAWSQVENLARFFNVFEKRGIDIFGVNLDTVKDNKKLKLPFFVWSDINKKITEHYLRVAGIALEQKKTITIFILDANQRVLDVKTGLEESLPTSILKFYGQLPPHQEPMLMSANAPVLLMPNLLDQRMCADLITLWKEGEHEESKVTSVVGDKEVTRKHTKVKKRRDFRIMDPELQKVLQQTIGRRIAPELEKVFHFEGFRFDRFVVVCYDSERGDYFRVHRDNLSPSTADRAFALTLNLNVEEYTGGELVFPEYGPHKYQPKSGGGIVFSCSLLHEALPVTRGRRFALLTFFRTLNNQQK